MNLCNRQHETGKRRIDEEREGERKWTLMGEEGRETCPEPLSYTLSISNPGVHRVGGGRGRQKIGKGEEETWKKTS